MGVITQEKSIYKGSTPTFTFTVYDSGAAYDLTSATVKFRAKTSTSASSYQFDRSCTLSSDEGVCTVKLTTTDTDTAGTYTAELHITTSGGDVIIPIQFVLHILSTVTT